GQHRFRHHAMMPGDQLAGSVKPGLDVMRGHRPEFAEDQIVLAAPDQLYRLADRLGEAHGLDDYLLLATAAEPAAQRVLMQRDLAALGLQKPRDLVESVGRPLSAGPDFRRLAVRTDGGGGAQRL